MRIKFMMLLFLTGCGGIQRGCTYFTGDLMEKCKQGVTYYQSDSGLALAVDKTGKPIECRE